MNRRRGAERGSASLELVGMLPIALIFAMFVLQAGATLWAITGANEAVRQGARASSMGGSACAAAEATLAPPLRPGSICTSPLGRGSIELEITVPNVSGLLPEFTIRRDAVLPDAT